MYQLIVYIPESHCEIVKQAMFDAGAGRYRGYEHCSWQTSGLGQFKPLAGSNPFIGKTNRVEMVEEIRVEMICEKDFIKAVISALKASHPYEEPAFAIYENLQIESLL